MGSQAHQLAGPDSDTDYRGVYVIPTIEILSLGHKYEGSSWFEGKEDQTTYEIGHFLQLATRCNPSILEVFKAPIVDQMPVNGIYEDNYGTQLQYLFSYVWNPNDAFNAFVGYGLNQRKKMLDNHLDRWMKYAVAYIRTLHNLCDLLRTGTFSLVVPDNTALKHEILNIKAGKRTIGEIIDFTERQTEEARLLLEEYKKGNKVQVPQLDKVHEFLYRIRREFWSF